MLIRLSKPSSESGGGGAAKPLPVDTVTVACPDHLVLADLPVAKGIGAATAATLVKTAGRRSRRQLGERVHFCVRCDFPIAIYGRLSPCEHAFCLDCARSDSICYLCDERIQKIQTIKIMEGIFICAAPHCLKSFLKRTDFESHIQESHADLLQPNAEKENDSEDKARRQQSREQPLARPMMQPRPPFFGQGQNYPSDPQPDNSRPPGFDRPGIQNHFQQSMQGGPPQEQQQGILSETPMPEYPAMHPIQPPNFVIPINSNPLMTPQYGLPPFQPEGAQPFYGAPYEMGQMARPDATSEIGAEQGSLLGFPPGPAGVNFMSNYSQPWNMGPAAGGQGMPDGFPNLSDSRGNAAFYQGEYGRNPGVLPMMPPPPPSANKGMEAVQGGNAMDARDSKGILAPQPFPHPPPPPPPLPHSSQPKRGKYYSGDMGHDGQSFGWQHENRDGFGSGQE
ncbi:E3 ubiquitin-protein ligase HAKAI homolog isoform X2 [Ricinus communis]|uniref:E3 ubiquitin-protein ligase HAKAI homolog isoform X2 n=1 Tax=Ricinus communis TaxID=3988 RepID=UPI0007727BEF|nr:E3 ubiquitin-protein ligase HAKAI homolog isoform X2 [Ricinus communis]|eukprot:XP_015580078.1 E3 ubiquitin-protein ligase Hakai isoform X2 [Ricinus communis]